MRPDEAHRWMDAELEKLERRIAKVYVQARDDLSDTVNAYFAEFQLRDQRMREEVGKIHNGRMWTESDYKQWRLNQIARGKRFEALRDKMAERYTHAYETAVSYVNDTTPGIYSLNRNYASYTIDRATGGALTLRDGGEQLNADFILYDEQTVKRLIVERPDVMPYYPPERAVQRGIDLAYGKSQITKNVTSGILRGLSVGKMADSLQERISTMSRTSALRAARTAVTAAQNAGRMDSYHAAQEMGIRLKKQWLATLDGRTRHSHQNLDGEEREADEEFSNGCRYPGDPKGRPEEVYNCRCTLVSVLPDLDLSQGQRRARNPVTGFDTVIDWTTYQSWLDSLKAFHGEKTVDIAFKKIHNEASDREQHKNYLKRLGDKVPQDFLAFQDMKYEEPETWELVKLDCRRRRTLAKHPEWALPNAENAVAPDGKFHSYLFNPENKKGWAKGRAFTSRLGYSIDNWRDLQDEIIQGATLYTAKFKENNGYGDLYEQRMVLYGTKKTPANVIVGWICKPDGSTSMTSAYIKEVK